MSDKLPYLDDDTRFWEKLFSSASGDIFLSVFNAIQEGIEIVDHEGWVKYVNPAFSKITGLQASARIGFNIRKLVPGGPLDRVIKTGCEVYGEKLSMKDAGIDIICNTAPIYIKGQLKGAIVVFQDVTELNKLNRQLRKSRHQIQTLSSRLSNLTSTSYGFTDIIGKSEGLLDCISLAKKVAPTESTTLITGESGTGKELFAHAIHRDSLRNNSSFIKVNCAAIPDNLLESELFGFEKGAFTGAGSRKLGMFDLAHEGTIFLDEIGDMSLALQAKILRVLEDGQVYRIGGTEPVNVNVRIIVATNRNLKKLCDEGRFRQDLYYRINVINIDIPPLRERRDDVMVLAEYFLNKLSRKVGRQVIAFSEDAEAILLSYSWPGNVRELRNCIERAVLTAEDSILTEQDLHFLQPQETSGKVVSMPASSIQNVEKEMIASYLDRFGWSVKGKEKTAAVLNISLRTLYNKIKRYNLNLP